MLLAMKNLGISSPSEVPRRFKGSNKSKRRVLIKLGRQMMYQLWQPPLKEELNVARESVKEYPRHDIKLPYGFCHCREGKKMFYFYLFCIGNYTDRVVYISN